MKLAEALDGPVKTRVPGYPPAPGCDPPRPWC